MKGAPTLPKAVQIKGRWYAVRPAQDRPRQPAARSTAVKPLSPAVEEARRERARRIVRETRTARNYENYGTGPLEWRRRRPD